MEYTPDEYVHNLCNVFDEVYRVLRKDGVFFLNIGDTYSLRRTTNGGTTETSSLRSKHTIESSRLVKQKKQMLAQSKPVCCGVPMKSLVGIPMRVALEMLNRNWILRNDILWVKKNPLPENVHDRLTNSYEHIYMFVKSQKYMWNKKYANEPAVSADRKLSEGCKRFVTRNMRDVWLTAVRAGKIKHTATFPDEIAERCILLTCPVNGVVLDPFVGSGTTCMVARRLQRKSIGIEINPFWVEHLKNRINV